jgi:hypothetical protein
MDLGYDAVRRIEALTIAPDADLVKLMFERAPPLSASPRPRTTLRRFDHTATATINATGWALATRDAPPRPASAAPAKPSSTRCGWTARIARRACRSQPTEPEARA